MRVGQTIRCLSGYAAPPHPGPLPQGERELHCACRAPAAFAPSPLTGEGWDEGGAGNSVIKRLRRPPLTLALSHKGRGNCIVLAEHRLLLLLLPGREKVGMRVER